MHFHVYLSSMYIEAPSLSPWADSKTTELRSAQGVYHHVPTIQVSDSPTQPQSYHCTIGGCLAGATRRATFVLTIPTYQWQLLPCKHATHIENSTSQHSILHKPPMELMGIESVKHVIQNRRWGQWLKGFNLLVQRISCTTWLRCSQTQATL